MYCTELYSLESRYIGPGTGGRSGYFGRGGENRDVEGMGREREDKKEEKGR